MSETTDLEIQNAEVDDLRPNGTLVVANESPPPAVSSPSQLLSAIIEMAKDKSLDLDRLETLLEMQQKMEVRQAEVEFAQALARLSAKMPHVSKNGTVSLGQGKGSYRFAKWEDMDKIIRPLMAEEGFVLSFDSKPDDNRIIITGTLLHKLGHSRSASMQLPIDSYGSGTGRNELQARGGTLAYGKRYTAEMLLNIVREGDDTDGQSGPKGFGAGETVGKR